MRHGPSALVTTVGASNANAYCTLAEADLYHENLPLAAVRLIWTAATDDDCNRAILTATRLIDRTFQFVGSRVTTTQALEWPRYVYSNYYWTLGDPSTGLYLIDATTIPARVKEATAEYARQLLVEDRTADATSASATGIKRLKADVIEIEYQSGVTTTVSKPVPDAVALLLSGLGYLHGTMHSVPLVRV